MLDREIENTMEISSSIDAYFHICLYKLNIELNKTVIVITGNIFNLKNIVYSDGI
jgi:hypothetical protein